MLSKFPLSDPLPLLPPLPLRVHLNTRCSDPTGRFQGPIVATFRDYPSALKWGNWDQEYVPPEGRHPLQPFHLVQTDRDGGLLIGVRDARQPLVARDGRDGGE